MRNEKTVLLEELEKLLNGGTAHASLEQALEGLPYNLLGEKPGGLPYSIWQLTEHIRIAQWDMLEFCKDARHQSPEWPAGYWPTEAAPASQEAWEKSAQQIRTDLAAFIALLQEADLYSPLPHGTGQTVLREALQIADHTAYHTAEIIVIRRLLGAWKP